MERESFSRTFSRDDRGARSSTANRLLVYLCREWLADLSVASAAMRTPEARTDDLPDTA